MTRQEPDCHRLSAKDMAARTPPRAALDPSRESVQLAAFYITPSIPLLVVGWELWAPAAAIIASILLWGAWSSRHTTRPALTTYLHQRQLNRQRQAIVSRAARAEDPTQVSGVRAGCWVSDKQTYDTKRQEFRRKHGRDAGNPLADYRLVVATVGVNGVRHRIAFTDGDIVDWNPNSRMFRSPLRIAAVEDPSVAEQAIALQVVIDLLSSERDGMPLRRLSFAFGAHEAALARALQIGRFWGLFHDDEVTAKLTEAGRLWAVCTVEHSRAREKRKRMSSSSGPRFYFSKDSNNTVHYSEGDIYQSTTNVQARPADREVIDALVAVLQRTDLPWTDPALAEARPALQRAVDEKDVQAPDARSAIQKLMDHRGAIALGVTGNAIYDTLKNFLS